MSRKYLIYGGIILFAAVVIPMLIKTARSASEEKDTSELQNKSQCKAITASGKRCSRETRPNNEYCWQHQN